MKYKRLMALDYGEVRIGIAMSDLMQIIASPYETYTRKNIERDLEYISNLAKNNDVEKIIIGLPLNMDGTEGDRAQKTRAFAELLKQHVDQEIIFFDERLSSVGAEELLLESNVRREKRKQIIDKVAGSLILESYMNSRK